MEIYIKGPGYIIDLHEVGIPYKGPFIGVNYIYDVRMPVAKLIPVEGHEENIIHELTLQRNNTLSTRRFILNESIYKSNHGLVESVDIYESYINDGIKGYKNEILFRKVPTNGNSLGCEAFFQYAARKILEEYGLGHMISRVHDIYRDPRIGNAVVFTMEPFFDIELLSNVLNEYNLQVDDIVSIIAQVAVVLCILCNRLDMNHRDMKTTNILLCQCADGIAMKDINIQDNSKITIKGKYCIKIVDFGFACSGTGKSTLINATTFFPMSDPCPKTGRDIFQLLTTMYLCTRFRDTVCVKEPFGSLFKKWLTVPGNDYLAFLRTLGDDSLDWVYLLLGSDKFRAPHCSPTAILTDLKTVFPSVVSII